MKNCVLFVLLIFILFFAGCINGTQEANPINNSVQPSIQDTIPLIAAHTPTQKESVPSTTKLIETQEKISFPQFDRADQIYGNWIKEDRFRWYLLTIKNDSAHRFLIKKLPKYEIYYSNLTDDSGKIIQTSSSQFQMIVGGDLLKTPEENGALTESNRAIWYYDESTGDLISDGGVHYKFLPIVNLADYQPLPPPPTSTPTATPGLLGTYPVYTPDPFFLVVTTNRIETLCPGGRVWDPIYGHCV